MPTRPGSIGIIEAGYTWSNDESEWLAQVVDQCARYDVGGGIAGFTVSVGAKTQVTSMYATATTREPEAWRTLLESFPPALARDVLAPTEFVGNCKYRLMRLAKASTSKHIAQSARTSATSMPSGWALINGNAATRAIVVCFPRRGAGPLDEAFPQRESRTLGLVGAHLGSALRLRELARPTADDPDTEAVLSSSGKVLHATGPAKSQRAFSALTHVVQSSRRARTASHEQALDEWTALVQGRWTILETVERDGKRLLLARRNRMHAREILELTQSERDVVWLAALGHSYKFIAYELGIPIGTVSSRLARAMTKLRVSSRSELIKRLGTGPTESTVRA